MITVRLLLPIAFLLTGCSSPSKLEALKRQLEEDFEKVEGAFAVAFKDLQTGEMLLINEAEEFHAASTMKTPVMIEVFKQAHEGGLSLTDSIPLKNSFASIVDGSEYSLNPDDDSEKDLYKLVGSKRSLRDLVYDMIIVSSNLATNLVIELADAKKVTQTMRDLGAMKIQVLRGVEDTKAYQQGLNNTTTAFDQLLIYEKLATGEAVNAQACNEMIHILLDQQFNEIIPAHLPEGVKVAHKTGFITGLHHDAGIVFLPDGRTYVLVLLSKNMPDPEAGVAAMALASKRIYDYVVE